MAPTLLVPIHLDALPLSGDRTVVNGAVDYSRLPYFDGRGDVNAGAAYLSEAIVDPPFHDEGLVLKAGTHLHWALPDALTKGTHSSGGTTFPAVPTRWLVTRSRTAKDGTSVPERRWVVESDYVAPPTGSAVSGVAFPFVARLDDQEGPPFRSVGRAMSLAEWLDPARDGGHEPAYLDQLTSAGYGHPAFAAVYANCHSLFGFHDPEQTTPEDGLQYDVIGWYGRAGDDYLTAWLSDLAAEAGAATPGDLSGPATLAGLATDLGWTPRAAFTRDSLTVTGVDTRALWDHLHARGWLLPLDEKTALVTTVAWRSARPLGDAFQPVAEAVAGLLDGAAAATLGTPLPTRILCFGRLRFQPEAGSDDPRLTLAVGNTGYEAVAAYLAAEVGPARAAELERRFSAVLELSAAAATPDVNARLAEARHERTFRQVTGESRWTISSQQRPGDLPDADADRDLPALPDDISATLAALNDLQDTADRTRQRIEAHRRQVFADWYRYLICSYPPYDEIQDYPDADLARAFLEQRGLAPLRELILAAARWDERRDAAAEQLQRALTDTGPTLEAAARYTLRQVAGPRYYQPTEPVVLLVGDLARPSPRYGQDGRLRPDGVLETRVAPDVDFADPVAAWSQIEPIWTELAQNVLAGDQIGFAGWRRPPWHPVLLDWEVNYFPRAQTGGLDGGYRSDYVTAAYELEPTTGDLAVRAGRNAVEQGTEFYSGSSILTPSSVDRARSLLAGYLVDLILQRDAEKFFAAVPIAAADRTADYLRDHVDLVADWYAQQVTTPGDPVGDLVAAYRRLGPDFPGLAQALSGFNEALLARKQTTQMPIADPFAFAADQDFVAGVRAAVQRANQTAPMPLADFNPIRAGALRVTQLRLIDSFGQVRDLKWDRLVVPEPLREAGNSTWISLPPRIVQPARIDLRWLDATESHTEAGAHPATTPICGWILPNHLDDSLALYDRDGVALGQIDQFAGWEPAPGAAVPVTLAHLHDPAFTGVNAHLRRVAAQLTRAPGAEDTGQSAFLAAFLATIETALDAIDPDGAAQQPGLALLFGRPLAVVRARVDLDLIEPPAVSQSWPAFDQDLRRATRDSQRFTQVRFPIRIGAPDQYDDGVVGYWKERPDGFDGGTFFAAFPALPSHPLIQPLDGPAAAIEQAVDDPVEELTLLMDARGSMHATSGVLPTKAITIPPEQFTAALAAMEVTFLTAPVLTAQDQLRLALPTEPGYRWSWLAPDPPVNAPVWAQTPADATIDRDTFMAHFPLAAALWAHLLDPDIRWLLPSGANASVLRPSQRRSPQLRGDFAGLERWTDTALGIDPATGAAPEAPVTLAALTSLLPDPPVAWAALTDPATGWLVPLAGRPAGAAIVPADQRPGAADGDRLTTAALTGALAGLENYIELLLDAYQTGIAPMRGDALSTGPQEVREGWLTLRPAPRPPDDARTR